jgi:hypothetical protein
MMHLSVHARPNGLKIPSGMLPIYEALPALCSRPAGLADLLATLGLTGCRNPCAWSIGLSIRVQRAALSCRDTAPVGAAAAVILPFAVRCCFLPSAEQGEKTSGGECGGLEQSAGG